jgi:hypothetical protein
MWVIPILWECIWPWKNYKKMKDLLCVYMPGNDPPPPPPGTKKKSNEN